LNIAYYITGHGYGHAVRSIEVIKGLLKQHLNIQIHIRTGAPEWLFREVLGNRTTFSNRHIEVGVLQNNSYSVDKEATLTAVADLLLQKDPIIKQEITFLQKEKISLVISDHTPFAMDAAHSTDIPVVGVANFSWDWIYGDYLNQFPKFKNVVQEIRNSYLLGDKLYRLPFYGDMPYLGKTIDVPLVGRMATTNRKTTRQQLGLSDVKKKLILLALKKQDLAGVNWEAVGEIKDYTFIMLSTDISHENIIHYNEGPIPFQNIVNACDAVISKPGYSMVAEILLNKIPMLYVPRNDFIEDAPLVHVLEKYAVSEQMSLSNLNSGRWGPFLNQLMAKPSMWQHLQKNGAMITARNILKDYNN
jgi:uncharacterized protein (TIGR00661 family)